MFGLKKTPEPDAVDASDVSAFQNAQKYPQYIETLAAKAVPGALAKAEELAAAFEAEHLRQLAGFYFECHRFGDFLTVSLRRDGNKGFNWRGEPNETAVSASINLGRTRDIQLKDGHAPDRSGELSFSITRCSQSGGHSWGTGQGTYPPGKGHWWEVNPRLPSVPAQRSLYYVEPPPAPQDKGHVIYMDNGEYTVKRTIANFPRAAKDDEIKFSGVNAILYVPFGKGRETMDAILAEISRSAPSTPDQSP